MALIIRYQTVMIIRSFKHSREIHIEFKAIKTTFDSSVVKLDKVQTELIIVNSEIECKIVW